VARSARAYDPAPGLWDAGPGNWEPAEPEGESPQDDWDDAASPWGAAPGDDGSPLSHWDDVPSHDDAAPRRTDNKRRHNGASATRWDSAPSHGDAPPSHWDNNSGYGEAPPRHWDNSSGQSEAQRSRWDTAAGHSEAPRSHWDTNSGHGEAQPGHWDSAPGDSEAPPSHWDTNPGHSGARRGHRDTKPRHNDASASRWDTAPGHREAAPGRWDAGPGDNQAAPDRWDIAPSHEAAAPGHRDGTPGYDPEQAGRQQADLEPEDTPYGYDDGAALAVASGQVDGYRGGPPVEDDLIAAEQRTAILINHGRSSASKKRASPIVRVAGVTAAVLAGVVGLVVLMLPGPGPAWPAGVAKVQAEITKACLNPDVSSEPGQVNFACGRSTRQILWIFALLTSHNDPNYAQAKTGRVGLEPISPTQGGVVAWSLNLHHPYDPTNPIDSIEVAARAINNIIGGATVTSSLGNPVIQAGLESHAANCLRYTGSAKVTSHKGYPDVCAQPVSSAAGQAALVTDVYQRWVVGASPKAAQTAATLFENAKNPASPQVQAILKTLPNANR
jgi:hypothetical protein